MHRVNRSQTPSADQMRRMALNLREKTGRGIVWQHVSAWAESANISMCYSLFYGDGEQYNGYTWAGTMDKYFEIMADGLEIAEPCTECGKVHARTCYEHAMNEAEYKGG